MSDRNSKFQRGSGVYTCECCKKSTRETGQGESAYQLCIYCYEVSGNQNSLSGEEISKEEYGEIVKALRTQYKHPGTKSDEIEEL